MVTVTEAGMVSGVSAGRAHADPPAAWGDADAHPSEKE